MLYHLLSVGFAYNKIGILFCGRKTNNVAKFVRRRDDLAGRSFREV